MSMSSGCLFEPATGFSGSSMIMASSLGFVCTFAASDNQLSSVYCSKVPDDGAVVNSTALTEHGGGCVTCLAAACLAASFHVLLDMAFSDHLLANGSITSVMHSEVSPAFLLSQWRTFSSSSIPSFHSVWGLLKVFLPKACMQWSLCRRSIAQLFEATAIGSVTKG